MSIYIKTNVKTGTTDEDKVALGCSYAYAVHNPERKTTLTSYAPDNSTEVSDIYKGIGNVAPKPKSDLNPNPGNQDNFKKKGEVKSVAKINGKQYRLDMAYSDKDGTDVQVWTNVSVKPHESIFVAQGSQSLDVGHRDGKDDANMGADKDPAQYQHAYEIYIKVNEARYNAIPRLPPITMLVGNSLGGGVVSYIGTKDKNAHVLAINPSPVQGMDEGKYSNIKTISGDDDILSILSKGIGIFTSGEETNVGNLAYGSDIKGFGRLDIIHNMVYFGHLGADPDKVDGYNMGQIMAISPIDGSVVNDLFYGRSLVGLCEKIYVDPLVISNMMYTLTNNGENQMGVIRESIKKVNDAAKNVSSNVSYRQAKLLEDFNKFLAKTLNNIDYTVLVQDIKPLAATINDCLIPIKSYEGSINTLLSYVAQVSGVPGIASIYSTLKNFANKISATVYPLETFTVTISDLVKTISELSDDLDTNMPKLFQGTDEGAGQKDGMPWAIKTYSKVLGTNRELLHEKFNNYLLTLEGAGNSLETTDSSLAEGIKSIDKMGIKQTDTSSCSYTLTQQLKDPDCISSQNILMSKKKQLDNNYEEFKNIIGTDLANMCGFLNNLCIEVSELWLLIIALAEEVEYVLALLGGAQRIILNSVQLGWLASDIDSGIKSFMNNIECVRQGIFTFKTQYADILIEITDKCSYPSAMKSILDGAKPYVDEAIFGGTKLGEVMWNSQIAKTAIDSLNSEFKDVASRLDTSNRGAAITALVSKADEVSITLQQFSDHMDKLIV